MTSTSAPAQEQLDDFGEKPQSFAGSAMRLAHRLTPHTRLIAAVLAASVGGIALAVIGPRVLGHATDLLFNGVIGKQLPPGLTKDQAIAALRARGDNGMADLVSGMNVVPGQGIDFGAVARTLLVASGIYLASALLLWAKGRLLNVIVQRTILTLRADVEDKLHRLQLSYFDGHQRGELLSRVTNDIDNIETSLWMTISPLLTAVLTVVAVLSMMLSISLLLTMITVLTVPLSILVTRVIAPRARRLFVEQWAVIGRLNAHVEETYSGLPLVKTFGQRARALERFRNLNSRVYRASFGAEFLSGLISPAAEFIANLNYVAVAVLGGMQVASGHITLGSVQAFIQYVRQFNQPVIQIASMYYVAQSGVASAERVFDLLDAAEQEPDPALALPSAVEPGPPGRVEFQHVNFSYRPGIPVIKDVSLVAEPGTTVAIVGRNGSGKTTLVNLLMRFYEVDSGRILIDGVDIATVSRQSLRSRIAMVLQDAWLFEGTIADNIGYGRPNASRDEIIAAAKAACVDRFVDTLPDGYDTRISDEGGDLSVGEKQLITVARAFLARPQLLILDEATSSVDTHTEVLIRQAMSQLRRGRTNFIIAHRLSTVRAADMILVMQAGRIIERGSHAELLAQRGAYYAMTRA
ncbi:ABC transporter ATP-binding protein [Mycobacterium kansasii]|uniref:Fatty acid ABC transporter ATP-binding/permease protein n=1 Tax=Mycobacterium attenuatum TaxID=2341086 RepID=A0A498PY13_9MYCO|nr:ABC transporter ATP-binding protein [Mycobacterium attenuatum]ORB86302.1 ABC transporter ATP-binding protein [Mycobacterium kansasii]VBA37122.1 putative ABC transporter ATP-binding protein [Mycobacterium attenuatum]VBA49993.1 putative ABC transporter ATP-binding protein [Mycobacterium attenuatum]VBA55607.1 putative ABC transporter ATP-binding protein [Mycobacterium attenuatum]